jgi:uncharacterized protein (TIGR00369 family)
MNATLHASPYPGLRDLGPEALHEWSRGYLPDWLGVELRRVDRERLVCRVPIRQALMAPHGYLHGGAVVSVADSLCGYGTIVNLPEGAKGFVTVELKTNFLGTIRSGAMVCEATPVHVGRTTQVWDAIARDEATDKMLATFRCTQLVLWD